MRALVIGGARSGIGIAKLLNQQGYNVILATNQDFKERPELEKLGIVVHLDDKDLSLVTNYDLVVKNPGIPNDHPLVSKFEGVVNEIEIASKIASDYKIYAISGTNGKTTATTLLHQMLLKKDSKALLAGNVGYALSEAVYHDGNSKRDVALEIAAFQMEGTPTFAPEVYGLINLTPDHLDRFASENDYYQAKLNILPNVKCFVRNADDQNIMNLTANYRGKVVDVSLDRLDTKVYLKDNAVWFENLELFKIASLKVVGKHNLLNATMAATIAYLAGVKLEDIQSAIAEFKAVEHRIEFVDTIDGVDYYNDSKATNPESCEVALQAFDRPLILLAGGYDKHISFEILRKYAQKLKHVYVFGESADQLMAVFESATRVETMHEAFDLASKQATHGDVVLLSPACASYDQFDNFEQRGNIFKQLVKNLSLKK